MTRKSVSRQQGVLSKRDRDALELLERAKKNLVFQPTRAALAVRAALMLGKKEPRQ